MALGTSGDTVTLMTTEAGGYTLDGQVFASGSMIAAPNGNQYLLTLAGGTWTASYLSQTVMLNLGTSGSAVTLTRAEDGSWWRDDAIQVSDGDIVAAGNGTQYRLMLGADGSWTASLVPAAVPDDHGNDPSSATRLALNSSLGGVIETAGDEDWFRLETGGQRHLKVRTTGSLDTFGTLFDSSNRRIAEDDDRGSGTNFALDSEVSAGVYYVRVRAYSSSQTGSYTIEEHGEPVSAPTPVTGVISTVPGSQGQAIDVAVDAAGNLYIADNSISVVRRVDVNGKSSTVAGTGSPGYSGDGGPATRAQLNLPHAVAVDAAGNLYIAEWGNHRVRKVDANGIITTVAGTGSKGYSGDGGPATNADLNNPNDVAVDRAGNLYIADHNNSRVRRVDPNGIITTVAQSAGGRSLTSVAVDAVGNVYFGTWHRFSRVDPAGVITTVAGNGSRGYGGDGGPATSAMFDFASGIAVDAAGNVYIADGNNSRVRRVDPSGIITTVAGTGTSGYSGDGGPATDAHLNHPEGVAVDANGNLYVSDLYNGHVRKVTFSSGGGAPPPPTGTITTVAGTGTSGYSGDGGPAVGARIALPFGVAVDVAGNLYIADTENHRVRRVNPAGTIETVAGTGTSGYSGDGGSAVSARVSFPFGVAVDTAGNLYIADTGNHVIRRVDPSGRITTVAGTGTQGDSGDGGPAVSAQLDEPWEVAVDGAGNLYIVALGNRGIRRVDRSGRIGTVAGVPSAYGIAVDAAGALYVPNVESHVVHRVDPSGRVTTVAGTGTQGYSGDEGPAASARIDSPTDVAVDSAGNLYIVDTENYRVRRVDPAGVIATVAGTGTRGYSGDGGPATSARIGGREGILRLALDAAGNLYIADTENHIVRKVALAAPGSGSP